MSSTDLETNNKPWKNKKLRTTSSTNQTTKLSKIERIDSTRNGSISILEQVKTSQASNLKETNRQIKHANKFFPLLLFWIIQLLKARSEFWLVTELFER